MSENGLEEKFLSLIDESAMETLKSEEFTEVSRKTMERIIKRDTLSIDEIDVYHACMSWEEVECAKQDIQVK